MITKEIIEQLKAASAQYKIWNEDHSFASKNFIALARNHIDELIERVEELEKYSLLSSEDREREMFGNWDKVKIKSLTAQNKALVMSNEKMLECLEKYAQPGRCGCTHEPEYDAIECLAEIDGEKK